MSHGLRVVLAWDGMEVSIMIYEHWFCVLVSLVWEGGIVIIFNNDIDPDLNYRAGLV